MGKKVSVLCITYNQEKYISKALDSIFSQNTTFDFEVIVHDDASTDGTKAIIEKYKERFGDKLKVYYEKNNKYSTGELEQILNDIIICDSESEYVAFCEGDDYWIDRQKLQIQVDYMDEHPKCVLTGHNSLWVDNITHEITVCNGIEKQGKVSVEEIIGNRRGCFATASMVLRREKFVRPEPFSECSIGDWPRKLYLAEQGDVYYFDRIMSVYNLYANNSWSLSTIQRKNRIIHELDMITFFKKLDAHWNYMYKNAIDRQIESFANDIIYQLDKDDTQDKESIISNIYSETGKKYCEACKMIIDRIGLKENENEKLIEFANKYTYRVIMGCGTKAIKLTELMEKLHMTVDGYVVSNNQTAPFEYNKKRVWRLCDMPFEKKNVAIIIGIQNDIQEEIVSSLNENGISEYFWPSI